MTFGTSVVGHNGITLGAGIGVGGPDRDIVTLVLYPSIVLHLVPDQAIVLQMVTDPRT